MLDWLPKTSVSNCQTAPRNIPEEHRPQLQRAGSLKPHRGLIVNCPLLTSLRQN